MPAFAQPVSHTIERPDTPIPGSEIPDGMLMVKAPSLGIGSEGVN